MGEKMKVPKGYKLCKDGDKYRKGFKVLCWNTWVCGDSNYIGEKHDGYHPCANKVRSKRKVKK